ncbi:MAG TPA: DUF2269 family protein [Gaiellaceae bacterium]|nr:DUF2269 family protein [Gaiellaceae bacterium]
MYEWALFLHLAGAILFFAGIAVAAVAEISARGPKRPSEVAAVLGTARWGVLLVASGLLLAVGAGFWLLEETVYGLDGWVQAALALVVVSFVAGGIGGQGPKRARRLAQQLSADGDERSPELDAALRAPLAAVFNAIASAAAVAILVLMVWKPGA